MSQFQMSLSTNRCTVDSMSDIENPYAPPTAELSEVEEAESACFATGTLRFAILACATFGIYELYWSYQNWKRIRDRRGLDLWPFWRAMFAPLWAYSLFTQIRGDADTEGIETQIWPIALAIPYFLFSSSSNLPDPYWVVSMVTFLFLLPANSAAARINEVSTPELPSVAPWTAATICGALVVGAFFAVSMFETFFPSAP